MPKVTSARYKGGKDVERNTFQFLLGMLEDGKSWSHGELLSLRVERRGGGIMVVLIQLHYFDVDGKEHYRVFEFPAFRHIEVAARKARAFIEQMDKEFEGGSE